MKGGAVKTKEQVEFEVMLAQRVAKLMDFAKPYVGRLSSADRNYLLATALHTAWLTRKEFDPEKAEEAGLLLWWNKCLRAAALTQRTWFVFHMDRWERVSGERLGT